MLAADGGKTNNAARIMPLHPLAARVVTDKLASLPDRPDGASMWPEVSATGRDQRRSKIIGNCFPVIRRRILSADDGADFHSFRRAFLTAAETVVHSGGRISAELVAHERKGLAFNLYSDWQRMSRSGFRGALGGRLRTLREAVGDVVELG